jgi:hypothetical protein
MITGQERAAVCGRPGNRWPPPRRAPAMGGLYYRAVEDGRLPPLPSTVDLPPIPVLGAKGDTRPRPVAGRKGDWVLLGRYGPRVQRVPLDPPGHGQPVSCGPVMGRCLRCLRMRPGPES